VSASSEGGGGRKNTKSTNLNLWEGQADRKGGRRIVEGEKFLYASIKGGKKMTTITTGKGHGGEKGELKNNAIPQKERERSGGRI